MPQPEIVMPTRANGHAAEHTLFGEQTASTLLSNILYVYRHHFGVIFWACLLPLAPFMLLLQLAEAVVPELAWIANGAFMMVGFVATAAMTVVLSDLCLGNKPTLRRAYTIVLGQRRWWHVISTSVVVTLATWAGFLLLVLPGLWLIVRTLFASTVVVLEGKRNIDAIRRSMALTRGQAWRLTGLTLLPMLLAFALFTLLALAAGAIISLGGLESTPYEHLLISIANLALLGLLMPSMGLTLVLLYYDQRARRESYDAQALSEDLMR